MIDTRIDTRNSAIRLLHPGPGRDASVEDAYDRPLGSHPDRPWVSLSMISSIDGSTVVKGTSGALSNPTDGAVLRQLRAIADVVIVGSGTVRGEGYGPPSKPGQRVGVVTARGSIDVTTELFTSGAGFVITTEDSAVDDSAVDVLRSGRGQVDLRNAILRIPDLCPGARFVQAEGGPRLNGSLLDADLLDEINATTSATLVGGSGQRLVSGADDAEHRYALVQLAVDDAAFVYARWLRRG